MSVVATSVAGLGVGDYDGQLGLIRYGNERQGVRWDADAGLWISRPRLSFKFSDAWMVDVKTAGPGVWMYFTGPFPIPAGGIGRSGFGWTPQAIHRADAAYAAGLQLQEKLDYVFWSWTAPDLISLATVYFELGVGDVISTLISSTAGDHIGVQIAALGGVRKFQSTGWVNSNIPTPTKPVLAPHIYTKTDRSDALSGQPRLEYLTAKYRWVGDPTP